MVNFGERCHIRIIPLHFPHEKFMKGKESYSCHVVEGKKATKRPGSMVARA